MSREKNFRIFYFWALTQGAREYGIVWVGDNGIGSARLRFLVRSQNSPFAFRSLKTQQNIFVHTIVHIKAFENGYFCHGIFSFFPSSKLKRSSFYKKVSAFSPFSKRCKVSTFSIALVRQKIDESVYNGCVFRRKRISLNVVFDFVGKTNNSLVSDSVEPIARFPALGTGFQLFPRLYPNDQKNSRTTLFLEQGIKPYCFQIVTLYKEDFSCDLEKQFT